MSQKESAAQMQQIIDTIEKQANKEVSSSNAVIRSNIVPETDEKRKMKMIETRIYVGLNDAITKEQKFETEKYLGILKNICRNYHVAFSLDIEEGGYFHESGEYTEETSLILVLVNPDQKIVQEIAKDLCTFFHQESVLVTEDCITGYFINKEEL